MTHILSRNTGCENMTSSVKAFESYCLTDRQTESTEIIYHSASLVINKVQIYEARYPRTTSSALDLLVQQI